MRSSDPVVNTVVLFFFCYKHGVVSVYVVMMGDDLWRGDKRPLTLTLPLWRMSRTMQALHSVGTGAVTGNLQSLSLPAERVSSFKIVTALIPGCGGKWHSDSSQVLDVDVSLS